MGRAGGLGTLDRWPTERAKATTTRSPGNGAKRAAARRSQRRRHVHGLPITTGDAVFRPLKTAEGFARDLVRDIVNRGLQTGDKLPSEAVMLEDYGLSRESLREGLRLLEVQGLITIRRGPGGGPIVGHLDPASLGRTSTLYFHLAGATYRELLEAWLVLEPILAERAARNPDRDARAGDDGALHRHPRTSRTTRPSKPSSPPTSTSTATWRRWPRTGCSSSTSRASGRSSSITSSVTPTRGRTGR